MAGSHRTLPALFRQQVQANERAVEALTPSNAQQSANFEAVPNCTGMDHEAGAATMQQPKKRARAQYNLCRHATTLFTSLSFKQAFPATYPACTLRGLRLTSLQCTRYLHKRQVDAKLDPVLTAQLAQSSAARHSMVRLTFASRLRDLKLRCWA